MLEVIIKKLRNRLCETAQILIEEIGSIGPENAEDAARRAVDIIRNLKKQDRRNNMKITYCKDGIAVPDHQAEEYAKNISEEDLRVASELVVHYARVLIAEGILSSDTIFEYEVDGVVVCSQKADSNGRLKEWPEGFCNHLDSYLDRLLNIKIV
jgi:hypothetical protein